MNRMFAGPLVEARGGGRNGGGAVLTDLGGAVVGLYQEAERKMSGSAVPEIEKIEQALCPVSQN